LPERVEIVRSNLLYLEKNNLPPAMLNRLLRLGAFQSPEFYKAQAMRLSTFGKPRIISCGEDLAQHIALPRAALLKPRPCSKITRSTLTAVMSVTPAPPLTRPSAVNCAPIKKTPSLAYAITTMGSCARRRLLAKRLLPLGSSRGGT